MQMECLGNMKKFKEVLKKQTDIAFVRRRRNFEAEYGLEPGGTWEGTYEDGRKVLAKHFKSRDRTIEGGLQMIEDVYGEVVWKKMKVKGVVTGRGYGRSFVEDALRSDVTVDGYVKHTGTPVQYRYMQSESSYTGVRYYRYNNSSLRLFNTLGLEPDSSKHDSMHGKGYSYVPASRARDKAPPL